MATKAEIARFFRLALRIALLDKAAVERWVDSVIAAEPVVSFPFTELAGASQRRREDVDGLLGQVTGDGDPQNSAHMVLALLRRRVRDGTFSPDAAVELAKEIARAGELPVRDLHAADALDEGLWLARSGIYGDVTTIRRGITEFFDRYEEFDQHIPEAA